MAKIVCVGLACLDYLFKVPQLPHGGGKYFADAFVAAPGGPAAVAGLTVASLGHQAIFLGRLGDDRVGHEVIEHLQRQGVHMERVRRIAGENTQVSAVVVDPAGERQIVNYSSSRLDPDPGWLPEQVIAEADILLTDVRWPEGAAAALTMARRHGVTSLIDADIAPVEIDALVDLATHVIYSERGLERVSRCNGIQPGLAQVARQRSAFQAVTAGDRGSYWMEAEHLRHCPAEEIMAVDTCGAGDVFHGAFAVAMVEGMATQEAMRFASAAAALKCLTFGGSRGVPSRQAVDNLLA